MVLQKNPPSGTDTQLGGTSLDRCFSQRTVEPMPPSAWDLHGEMSPQDT